VKLADSDFAIVHTLALRKRSHLEALAGATGADVATVEAALGRAAGAKFVLTARGNYFVAPEGERMLRAEYAERYAAVRADPAFVTSYERFEQVNRDIKALVTEWQMRAIGGRRVVNDHGDPAYDEGVLDRLAEAHAKADEVISKFASALPRVGRYRERLGAALERAEAGEPEWVSGVRCDSYHTVWFELHEDLLRILGRERTEG
jgi:hypothetical protein